jgi:hypothetical protein
MCTYWMALQSVSLLFGRRVARLLPHLGPFKESPAAAKPMVETLYTLTDSLGVEVCPFPSFRLGLRRRGPHERSRVSLVAL